MFGFKHNVAYDKSVSSSTEPRTSDALLECILTCDSPEKRKITQQLEGYERSIQKKIMVEKKEKGEELTMSLTPENFPDYFYTVLVNKRNSFLAVSSSKYEIKIVGTHDALKSAIEALVFAGFYDKSFCTLPPSLVEYADQLLSGNAPSIIDKIDFNF